MITRRLQFVGGFLGLAALIVWVASERFNWRPRRPSPEINPPANFGRLDPQLKNLILEKAGAAAAHPWDPARHAELGLVYSANGLWIDAANAYSNALVLGSKDPMVWQYQGVALLQAANLESAAESLRHAEMLRPDASAAPWYLGQIYLQTGRMADAAEKFLQVTRIEPKEWRGHAGLGQALLQQGRNPEAVDALERATTLAPQARAAHALFARALMAAGDHDRAKLELALGKGAEVSPPSDAWTDRARTYQKTVPDQMELAGELEAAGQLREAAMLLAEVARHHPKNPVVLNRLAMSFNHMENAADAEFYARQALAINPEYLPAMVTLSFSLVALARFAEGLAAAERAERLSPMIIQPRLARANALLASGRDDDAVQALRSALELEPNNPEVLAELGDVTWRNLGRSAEAQTLYVRANGFDPAFTRPIERLVELHWEAGQHGLAATWLAKLRLVEGASSTVLAWEKRLDNAKVNP